MEFSYIHILQYLGYDVQKAQSRIEQCGGFRGDMGHSGFKKIVEQAETQPAIELNASLLVLTDRLYGLAVGLHYFMKKCTGANVDVAFNKQEAMDSVNCKTPDFLIILGYLDDDYNYEIIPYLRELKNPPCIVMFASPDMLIRDICVEHNIFYMFDRREPISEFVKFLKTIVASREQTQQEDKGRSILRWLKWLFK